MHVELQLDDELVTKASEFAGITGTQELVTAALRVLIQDNAYKRLIEFAGSNPDMEDIPRRRPAA